MKQFLSENYRNRIQKLAGVVHGIDQDAKPEEATDEVLSQLSSEELGKLKLQASRAGNGALANRIEEFVDGID